MLSMPERLDIQIVCDTVCPWCFIGKRKLDQALAELPEVDAHVTWNPFLLDPDLPSEGVDSMEYLISTFGSRRTIAGLIDQVRTAAETVDIALDFEAQKIHPNSLDSHRVVHWGQERGLGDQVLEALFSAYFEQGRNLTRKEVLADIAAEGGLDRAEIHARLGTDRDVDTIKAQFREARNACVTTVPTFSIDGILLPGAQEPKVFVHAIRRVLERRHLGSRSG